jgi:hypothetical protein
MIVCMRSYVCVCVCVYVCMCVCACVRACVRARMRDLKRLERRQADSWFEMNCTSRIKLWA